MRHRFFSESPPILLFSNNHENNSNIKSFFLRSTFIFIMTIKRHTGEFLARLYLEGHLTEMLVILAVVFFVIFIAVAFYMKPQQGMLSILLGSARNLFLFVPKFSFPFILFSIETSKLVGVTEPPVLDTPNEDEKKDEEEEESDHSELLEAPVLSEDEDGIVVHPPSYCS